MSVYVFGDRIPTGDRADVFVTYTVEGVPGGFLTGPFTDPKEQLEDIKTYEGVTGARLITRAELYTTQFYPYIEDT